MCERPKIEKLSAQSCFFNGLCCTVEVQFFPAGHRVDKQVISIDFQKIS